MSRLQKLAKCILACKSSILFGMGIVSGSNVLVAQVWQDYPQPIGELVRVWNVAGPIPFPTQLPAPAHPFPAPTIPLEEINYICAQWDNNMETTTVPFDLNFPATEIISTRNQHFVRVYAPGNAPNTGSGPNGAWFMRSSYVRGLTPEQIRDRFALPATPTMIVNVEFPASPSAAGKDYAIWTGIAGPIATWGNGGALQNRIVADFNGTNYFPDYEFTIGSRDHPQPIGIYALSYTPMAGNGNAGRIASYLDKFIPTAYSDMEDVYTALDYLNWVGFGPEPIQEALNQISPERYGALAFAAERNALLFSSTLLDFRYSCNACMNPCETDLCSDFTPCSTTKFGLQFVTEYGKVDSEKKHPGLSYTTLGGIANVEMQLDSPLTIGVQAAYFNTGNLRFKKGGGSGDLQMVMGGLYASYDHPCFFVDGLLSGGYNWGKAHRSIEFPGVDRQARCRPSGFDAEAHLQIGKNLDLCRWCVTPLLRASYFYVRENHFQEHGADSLNLSVHSFSAQTLRTVLGAGLTRTFGIGCIRLIPQIQLGWAHDFVLDHRKIRADLIELADAFTVEGFHRDRNSFLADVQLKAQLNDCVSLSGRYDAEIGQYFVAQAVQVAFDWNF